MKARKDEHTRYFRTPSGSVGEIADSHADAGGLPDGAVEITEAEFQEARTSWEAGVADHVADLEAADAELAQEAYEALRTAGIPEKSARRLSGFHAQPS
ncbi:hypothetical protein [Streptosporangium sp. NPDC002721]|uniref:hypothetical protein n=1 Tax=Streptosporangium sp. NPDC002721 TaxID=3366188 RepID=UPI0036912367